MGIDPDEQVIGYTCSYYSLKFNKFNNTSHTTREVFYE